MEYTLSVAPRELKGRKTKQLRRSGIMPAVLYGNGIESSSLQLNIRDFSDVFAVAGTSSLVNLHIEGKKPVKVLLRDLNIDPVTLRPQHVDFYQINMKEKIRTDIPLEFIGESPVVVDQDGKLVHSLDALEVECLPDDLVPHIEVDLSGLAEFDQAIHVKDLQIPEGIEVLTDTELVVVVAQAPISEAELEAELAAETSEADAVAAVEVEEKGEGEEAAEGEEPKSE